MLNVYSRRVADAWRCPCRAMNRLTLILLVLTTCVAPGAEWPAGSAIEHAYLEVVIANHTSQNVAETGVYFGKHTCTAGIVGAGASAGYIGWEYPVTTKAIVRWRNAQGVRKEETVE